MEATFYPGPTMPRSSSGGDGGEAAATAAAAAAAPPPPANPGRRRTSSDSLMRGWAEELSKYDAEHQIYVQRWLMLG